MNQPAAKLTKISDAPFKRRFDFEESDLPGWVVFDAYGRIIEHQMAFIMKKCGDWTSDTLDTNVTKLLDYECVAAKAHNGAGVAWPPDDEFLEVWDRHMRGAKVDKFGQQTGNRGLAAATQNDNLRLVLRSILHWQEKGFCAGAIGPAVKGKPKPRVIIKRPTRGGISHRLFQKPGKPQEVTLPSHDDFELVEAEFISRPRNKALRHRNRRMCSLWRGHGLRRIEVARAKIDDLPSKPAATKAKDAGNLDVTFDMTIISAKNGNKRLLNLTAAEVLDLWEYVEKWRGNLNPKPFVREIFTSKKTREGLVPQSLTNSYKDAAHAASNKYDSDKIKFKLKDIRLHLNRHRAFTDIATNHLLEGVSIADAVAQVAKAGAITMEVAEHYVHLADDELNKQSPKFIAAEARSNKQKLGILKSTRIAMRPYRNRDFFRD